MQTFCMLSDISGTEVMDERMDERAGRDRKRWE